MPLQLYKIASTDLTASASSVTFSSIPQGYTDLKIVVSARDASTGSYANDFLISINGSTANLSNRMLYGTGAAVASTTNATWVANVPANTSTANTFGNTELYFPNYNSTTTSKSYSVDSVTENNATNALAMLNAGLYSSNTAISSIGFSLAGGTSFTANSTFSLYGIL